jgi:hypothetical protein
MKSSLGSFFPEVFPSKIGLSAESTFFWLALTVLTVTVAQLHLGSAAPSLSLTMALSFFLPYLGRFPFLVHAGPFGRDVLSSVLL